MKTGYCFESIIGDIYIIEEEGKLISVTSEINEDMNVIQRLTPFIQSVINEIQLYFNKEIDRFTSPIKITGTPFEQAVYNALITVPFGTTISYKSLAQKAGYPMGYRAVGNALNKNPLFLYVPCHRVIKEDSTIGGFALDLSIKSKLLKHEGVKL